MLLEAGNFRTDSSCCIPLLMDCTQNLVKSNFDNHQSLLSLLNCFCGYWRNPCKSPFAYWIDLIHFLISGQFHPFLGDDADGYYPAQVEMRNFGCHPVENYYNYWTEVESRKDGLYLRRGHSENQMRSLFAYSRIRLSALIFFIISYEYFEGSAGRFILSESVRIT